MKATRHKKLFQTLAPVLCDGDFFIHIGANDGITNDPVYSFIRPISLRGLAIEPIRSAFEQLVHNYRDFPGVVCVNAAIHSGVPSPVYRVRDDLIQQYPAFSQISTFNKQQLLDSLQKILEGNLDQSAYSKAGLDFRLHAAADIASCIVEERDTVYLTFDELLQQYQVPQIDFLNIDAEGVDYVILMSLDLNRWTPKVLIVESLFFSAEQKERLEEKLAHHHYRLVQKFDFYSDVYIRRV